MARNEWAYWSDFVGMFMATGFIKGELAQSLLLVGEPGTGKSTMIERFHNVSTAIVAMDATAEGLKQQVFKRAIREHKRHLLLPEMFKLMQRRGPTADNTVGVLTLAMSGEMYDSFIGDKQADEFPRDFQLGIIGAMPSKVFKDWQQTINNTGLLSRMVAVKFGFSPEMQTKILAAIAAQDNRYTSPVSFPWPDHAINVGYSGTRIGPHVLRLAGELGDRQGKPRFTRLLVSLVKAVAILEQKDHVLPGHIGGVEQFGKILRSAY